MRRALFAALAVTAVCSAPMAKEFYSFPQANDMQGRDISLFRRPAAAGYDNATGTRNITGTTIFSAMSARYASKARLADYSGRLSAVQQNLTSYARLNGEVRFNNIVIPDYGDITIGGGGGFTGTILSNSGIDAGFFYGTWFGASPSNRVSGGDLYEISQHRFTLGNPHGAEPYQIFGQPTSSRRFPLFDTDGSFAWSRPLEACVDVFDGAPGATGATGPAGSISVGSTTTLDPGQSAYVIFTGPSSARLAHFGIPKGATGDAGVITQAAVFGAADDPSNLPLLLQGNSDNDVKVQILYDTGETSIGITASGLLFAQDKAGHITWGWNNDTKEMVFSNYSFSSVRKSMTVDRFGQVTRYAANGTTLIFASTTTGRIKRWNKTTGKLQEHIAPDGTRTLYRPDGIKVRFENRTSGVTVL